MPTGRVTVEPKLACGKCGRPEVHALASATAEALVGHLVAAVEDHDLEAQRPGEVLHGAGRVCKLGSKKRWGMRPSWCQDKPPDVSRGHRKLARKHAMKLTCAEPRNTAAANNGDFCRFLMYNFCSKDLVGDTHTRVHAEK